MFVDMPNEELLYEKRGTANSLTPTLTNSIRLLHYQCTCLERISQLDMVTQQHILIKRINDFVKEQRKIAEDIQHCISKIYTGIENSNEDEMQNSLGPNVDIEKNDDGIMVNISELPPKKFYYSQREGFLPEYEPRAALRRRLDDAFASACADEDDLKMDEGKVLVTYRFFVREGSVSDVDNFDIKIINDILTEYLLFDDNYKYVSILLEGKECEKGKEKEHTEVYITYAD